MKRLVAIGSLLMAAALFAATFAWDFEKTPIGKVPKGWQVGVTNADTLPEWKVVGQRGNRVLLMAKPAVSGGVFGIGSVFNLCYTREAAAEDLDATVRFKALSGREDQGGGIMWRVKDDGTYYVARFNPLEDNFNFYKVVRSHRSKIAGARVKPAPGWHTMRIVQKGGRFEGYLDGKRILSATDSSIEGRGGTGLWTKADAVTAFDDFRVKVLK
ncbi:family 16 glycoside hydrolase [Hydrogenimonas sp. SS33]|uniref:family 16 glycoside hydrolase n=1 Tax=Hydrogenimonas leucolamina TaxID=2954236 RepID=UPI00336C2187